MSLLADILELVAPTRCAGCDLPGSLLCERCDSGLPRIDRPKACPRCGAPYGALVCTECWNAATAFSEVIALGELDEPLSRAVVLHKDASERRLGALLGAMLGTLVAQEWPDWAECVAWIPPTREAMTRRGFDHGLGIARPVAVRSGAPLSSLLERERARDQRKLGRRSRTLNAKGTFRIRQNALVPSRILVVDDVLTTGATLDAAAEALLEAGAMEVRAAVLARAW